MSSVSQNGAFPTHKLFWRFFSAKLSMQGNYHLNLKGQRNCWWIDPKYSVGATLSWDLSGPRRESRLRPAGAARRFACRLRTFMPAAEGGGHLLAAGDTRLPITASLPGSSSPRNVFALARASDGKDQGCLHSLAHSAIEKQSNDDKSERCRYGGNKSCVYSFWRWELGLRKYSIWLLKQFLLFRLCYCF